MNEAEEEVTGAAQVPQRKLCYLERVVCSHLSFFSVVLSPSFSLSLKIFLFILDPYCKLACGGRTAKSTVKKNNLNPDWNETFTLYALLLPPLSSPVHLYFIMHLSFYPFFILTLFRIGLLCMEERSSKSISSTKT